MNCIRCNLIIERDKIYLQLCKSCLDECNRLFPLDEIVENETEMEERYKEWLKNDNRP